MSRPAPDTEDEPSAKRAKVVESLDADEGATEFWLEDERHLCDMVFKVAFGADSPTLTFHLSRKHASDVSVWFKERIRLLAKDGVAAELTLESTGANAPFACAEDAIKFMQKVIYTEYGCTWNTVTAFCDKLADARWLKFIHQVNYFECTELFNDAIRMLKRYWAEGDAGERALVTSTPDASALLELAHRFHWEWLPPLLSSHITEAHLKADKEGTLARHAAPLLLKELQQYREKEKRMNAIVQSQLDTYISHKSTWCKHYTGDISQVDACDGKHAGVCETDHTLPKENYYAAGNFATWRRLASVLHGVEYSF